MPVYEYDCPDCGARFEAYLKTTDERVACPRCGGTRLEKRFSVFAAAKGAGPAAAAAPPRPT